MSRWIALLAVSLLPTLAAGTFAPGDNDRTLTYGGLVRSYRVHVPPAWTVFSRSAVVLDIHGWTANAATQQALSGLAAVSDREGFLVVWPQGVNNQWNAGICCGNAGIDDVGFLRAVVNAVVAEGNADPRRVFATGLSNGGAMSHKLACEASDMFAAAAPMAFPLPYSNLSQCQPGRPIPVLMVMGLTDALIQYHGGNFGSAQGTFARWRDLHGCVGAADFEPQGQGYCETFTPPMCTSGQEVRLCSIVAQAFPGVFFDGHLLYLNDDLNLGEEAWRFFARFRRPPEMPGEPTELQGWSRLRLDGKAARRDGTNWGVAVGPTTWVVSTDSGALLDGPAPFALVRRRLSLSLDGYSQAAVRDEIAEWMETLSGTLPAQVAVSPQSVLRVRFDRNGIPRRLSGTVRLQEAGSGRRLGALTVRLRRSP